ncbi:MAG: signal peptidase I [Acidobacteriota bacterium]
MSKSKKRKPSRSKESTPTWKPGVLREYFLTIVICSVVALFVTTYVVHPMSVPTPSMEPAILVGDRVLVDKFTIRNGFKSGLPLLPTYQIQRHDIIVCKSPIQPDILLVKRVIGLPGETLEIRDKIVHIQGEPLDEPFTNHSDDRIYSKGGPNPLIPMDRDNYGPVTIPEDSYFVMGDNRDDSLDSRFWRFLPRHNIVGKPLFIFWSYEDGPDAHLKSTPGELLQLYGERILFFLSRTRWSRMGKLVR